MTLVLSCLTEGCVIQVSDRRLTDVKRGQAVPGEFNKAVLFTNRLAFSYTGLASIEARATDEWLADTLASGDDEQESLVAVRDRATAAFSSLRVPLVLKSHAFVGVGWDRPPDEPWSPWLCWISNSLDGEARWHATPRDRFDLYAHRLIPKKGEHPVALHVAGQRLKREEHVRLMRDLRRYADHDAPPGLISDRLVAQVREVAARTQRVGEDVMVNSIPLLPDKFASGALVAISARPTRDTQAFSYIPAGGEAEIELGPRGAWPGGAQVFDFRARELDRPGDVEVVVGFKTPRSLR